MKKVVVIVGATVLLSLAYASEQVAWPNPYRPFKGEYIIYSGDFGDQQPPTKTDRKLFIIIDGQLAKVIFNAMPPVTSKLASARKASVVAARRMSGAPCALTTGTPATQVRPVDWQE